MKKEKLTYIYTKYYDNPFDERTADALAKILALLKQGSRAKMHLIHTRYIPRRPPPPPPPPPPFHLALFDTPGSQQCCWQYTINDVYVMPYMVARNVAGADCSGKNNPHLGDSSRRHKLTGSVWNARFHYSGYCRRLSVLGVGSQLWLS